MYDVPVDASLARLLQHCPRAWAMVQATIKSWSAAPPPRGSSREICDITDGSVFFNHPELGDEARRQRIKDGGDGKIRLGIILYYDDLTTTNALGVASLTHSMGMFYYALVNLDPSVRMSLKYIQLAAICFSSDIKRYGAEAVVGGGASDPYDSPSIGASMRRLNDGVLMDLLFNGAYRMCTVCAWVIWFCADYPARGKMTPFAESVSALCFDHKSNRHRDGKGAKLPTSYLEGHNPHLKHHWREKTVVDLARQKGRAEEFETATLRNDFLQSVGVKKPTPTTPLFGCALNNLPYFDISGKTGMVGEDLMHHEFE